MEMEKAILDRTDSLLLHSERWGVIRPALKNGGVIPRISCTVF